MMFHEEVYSCKSAMPTMAEHSRMYVSEDRTTAPQMTPEEVYDKITDLEQSQSRLKKINVELQHSVELLGDENALLRTEKTALCNQVKRLKQSIDDAEQLTAELLDCRNLVAEKESLINDLKNQIRVLDKENNVLVEKNETLNGDMSFLMSEKSKVKDRMGKLSNTLQSLQHHLEETRLGLNQKESIIQEKNWQLEQLEQSISEYSTNLTDQKNRIKELESLLEEEQYSAVAMAGDGPLQAPASPCPVSLADELLHLPSTMVQQEEVLEKVQSDKSVRDQATSWWIQPAQNMLKGAQAAGALTLGFVIPLGLLASTMPACYDQTGYSCHDALLNSARFLLQPYCDVHHVGVPPM